MPVNVESETAKATTTVTDDTGALTGSTVTKTEKHFMVVTGPNDAGVAAPVEIRREAATVIERDAAGNEIGSSSTKIERQNMEIDGVTVTDETKTKTATATERGAAGETIGSIVLFLRAKPGWFLS